MIETLNNPKKIKSAYKRLRAQLLPFFSEKIFCKIGYHGGSFDETVSYSEILDLWYVSWEEDYVIKNLFGTGRPVENGICSMTGQINIPTQTVNRSIAGSFATGPSKEILLLHRGNIGGGKKDIGKHSFLENYRGEVEEVNESGVGTNFCIIGEVDSPMLPQQIRNFIYEISRIKALLSGHATFDINEYRFSDERGGKYMLGDLKRKKNANRTHYLVVNRLAHILQSYGFQVGSDRNRDLFIHDGKKIRILFEVKSYLSTQNLYSAVGQLLVYSIPIKNKVKLIFVIPDKLDPSVTKKLRSLGIDILYFHWDDAMQPIWSKKQLAKII
jgi:hypothetical protein